MVTTDILRLPFFMLILSSCSASKDFAGHARNTTATSAGETESNPDLIRPATQTSPGTTSASPTEATAETVNAELAPDAQVPVVVSGGYLTCTLSIDSKLIACSIHQENNVAYTVSPSALLKWTIVDAANVSTSVTPKSTQTNSGSFYYVPVSGPNFKSVSLELNLGTQSQSFSFKASELPSEGGVFVRSAIAVDTFTAKGTNHTYNVNSRVGDGIAGAEGDSCLADQPGFYAPSMDLSTNDANAGTSDVYVVSVCGLQKTNGWASLGLPGRPAIKVRLLPAVAIQKIAAEVPILSGGKIFGFGIEAEPESPQILDDWTIGSFQFDMY